MEGPTLPHAVTFGPEATAHAGIRGVIPKGTRQLLAAGHIWHVELVIFGLIMVLLGGIGLIKVGTNRRWMPVTVAGVLLVVVVISILVVTQVVCGTGCQIIS
jgi:hypothetical protein